MKASKKCSSCHCTFYCSKSHQILDWTTGQHSELCSKLKENNYSHMVSSDAMNSLLFPYFEITHEEESGSIQEQSDDEDDLEEDIEESANGDELSLVSTQPQSPSPNKFDNDAIFLSFQKEIQHHPEQVLRYLRADIQHSPLRLHSQFPASTESPCTCGSLRTPEFQIMPQILTYIKTDVDFGTLVIYTCDASCGVGFLGEECIRQNFKSATK